jgi:hypothetical protein
VRRSRLLVFVTVVATVLSGAFLFHSAGAGADTATVDIDTEGWFDRFRDEDVQVNPNQPVPNTTETTTVCGVVGQVRGCGALSPGDNPEPRSKSTGAYVVASAGGDAGDRTDTGGDTAWAAFKWDMFSYEGASVDKFVASFTLAEDNSNRNQGDTYTGTESLPPFQACNVLEDWGSETGPNPWFARPIPSGDCVPPTNANGTATTTGRTFRFDLTKFAQTWVENKGYGIVIRPGTPTTKTNLPQFQITFSGYYDTAANSSGCSAPATVPPGTTTQCTTTSPTLPVVEFAFTPGIEEDLFGGGDFGGDDGSFFEEISTSPAEGILEAVPDIDVLPDDVGSEPLPEDVAADAAASTELGGPTSNGQRGTRPISAETSFPWAVLLLLPMVAVAFWGTGTALGPIGDPVPARRGGVSRVLAQRQAAHRGIDSRRGT